MNDTQAISGEAFDWVKARLACSPEKVFQHLKLEVTADVASRNTAPTSMGKWQFDMTSHNGSFVVFVKGRDSNKGAVTFEQTERGIDVKNEKDAIVLSATLTINNSKECRLKVSGQEYEPWQFRKMALEELFFGDPWRAA